MKSINNFITEKIFINQNININEKLILNKNIKFKKYNYYPKDKEELKELIDKLIDERGNNADLNDIDTSDITDMSKIFYKSEFDGDISNWDVSNVTNMYKMFTSSNFTGKNGDISNWDVSNVENTFAMFSFSPIRQNPPKWFKKFS